MNAMQTNGEAYQALPDEEKNNFREIYGNHPLADYIDWQAYYASNNGNALDFVRCIDKYKDKDGKQVYVLEDITEDDLDYKLIFVCEDNTFCKVPA